MWLSFVALKPILVACYNSESADHAFNLYSAYKLNRNRLNVLSLKQDRI